MIPSSHSQVPAWDAASNIAYLGLGIWAALGAGEAGIVFAILMASLALGSGLFHSRVINSDWDVIAMFALLIYLLLTTAALPLGIKDGLPYAFGILAYAGALGLRFALTRFSMEQKVGALVALLLLAAGILVPSSLHLWIAAGTGLAALALRVWAPPETHGHWHIMSAVSVSLYLTALPFCITPQQ